jgi:hypothetical protein
LLVAAVNWTELNAIATSVLAIGLLGGFGAAVFAAQQVRETRRSREAQMAAEFFRLAALESVGAVDLPLIRLMLGRTLIQRWEMWRPAIHEAFGPGVYPMFEGLVTKLRAGSEVAFDRLQDGRGVGDIIAVSQRALVVDRGDHASG